MWVCRPRAVSIHVSGVFGVDKCHDSSIWEGDGEIEKLVSGKHSTGSDLSSQFAGNCTSFELHLGEGPLHVMKCSRPNNHVGSILIIEKHSRGNVGNIDITTSVKKIDRCPDRGRGTC